MGAPALGTYRVYFIRADGKVSHRVELVSYDENDAKEQARGLADMERVELWKDNQMVARYEPGGPASPSSNEA